MSFTNLSTTSTTINNNSNINNHQLSLSAISESSVQSAPQEMNVKVNPYIPSKIIYNKILQKVSKHDKQRIEQLRLLNNHLSDQQFIRIFLQKEKALYYNQIQQEENDKIKELNQKPEEKWDITKWKPKVLKPGDEDYAPPKLNNNQTLEEHIQEYIYKDNCWNFKKPKDLNKIVNNIRTANMYEDKQQTHFGLICKEIDQTMQLMFNRLALYKHTDKTQIKVLSKTQPADIHMIAYNLFNHRLNQQQYQDQLDNKQQYIIDCITTGMDKPKPAEVIINKSKINR